LLSRIKIISCNELSAAVSYPEVCKSSLELNI